MQRRCRLLGAVLATGALGLMAAPVADATMLEQFRFSDEPYTDTATVCGIDVTISGTDSGSGRVRIGKGRTASAFFEHVNFSFTETWTAAGGRSVTVTGRATFHEIRAVPLGGTLFRFTAIETGQPFRLYAPDGTLLLRDRGVIRHSAIFNTLGDATPGGILVEELEPVVHGPHPGFDDETLCPVLVPLLTAPAP